MARIVELAPSPHHRSRGGKKGSRRRDKILGRRRKNTAVINIAIDYVMPTMSIFISDTWGVYQKDNNQVETM